MHLSCASFLAQVRLELIEAFKEVIQKEFSMIWVGEKR